MAIAAIGSSVFAAFVAWGFLKALTPFAIASTPVRAPEPEAKARRSTKMVTAPVPLEAGWARRRAAAIRAAHSTADADQHEHRRR